VRILPFINHPNLKVLAPLLEVDEYRMLDGWSRDRKKGSNRYERIPVDIIDILEFSSDDDFRKYIPKKIGEDFTVKEFAAEVKIPENRARGVLKVFLKKGIIVNTGKQGRSFHYSVT